MGHDHQHVAYFDCFSGASGDMLLGALLDAGLSLEDLKQDLATLNFCGYELQSTRYVSHGLTGVRFTVVENNAERPFRHLSVVRELIEACALPEAVKHNSLRVFERIAAAEARVHGVDIEQVHFHELGAVDTLVDVVGFCCAMERLGLDALYASPLPLGGGTVTTDHGLLPVPAPATLALLAEVGAPTRPAPGPGELVTPTGAALLTTLATFEQPAMHVTGVGYGFGHKEFAWANVLRVWLGQVGHDASLCQQRPWAHSQTHEHDEGEGHAHGTNDSHSHAHTHACDAHHHHHPEDGQ
jgi:hypothetical protein